jgi:exo-1,4-beta-D-glucosaminidase
MDWKKTEFDKTEVAEDADMTLLNDLPVAGLEASMSDFGLLTPNGNGDVKVKNSGKTLAFFVRLKLVRERDGKEILPVLWTDNYLSLLPGESRTVAVSYDILSLKGSKPRVELEGWNVPKQVLKY